MALPLTNYVVYTRCRMLWRTSSSALEVETITTVSCQLNNASTLSCLSWRTTIDLVDFSFFCYRTSTVEQSCIRPITAWPLLRTLLFRWALKIAYIVLLTKISGCTAAKQCSMFTWLDTNCIDVDMRCTGSCIGLTGVFMVKEIQPFTVHQWSTYLLKRSSVEIFIGQPPWQLTSQVNNRPVQVV